MVSFISFLLIYFKPYFIKVVLLCVINLNECRYTCMIYLINTYILVVQKYVSSFQLF